MSERRYNEDEVAAIFQVAAEQQQAALGPSAPASSTPLASSHGMTLAQLQDIGREVGIPADLVARAAGSLEKKGTPTVRKFFGLPIGVGRTVTLQRRLSDEEWERLVVDLRETFDARGRLKEEGSFRQWTNGNLQALLEPTATGQQLRLKTLKGNAYGLLAGGLALLAVGLFMILREGGATGWPLAGRWGPFVFPALIGAGMFAAGALRLPGWAKLRRKQMEEIAARLTDTTQT
jgi:hypothetical protein